MANLGVSKKVSLIGSWSEDVLTNEFLNRVANQAKTEKGTKMKLKVNELGMRLTRTTFLQGSKTAFFPIKSVQTVMQAEEFPQCVMFVLSDPNKKYKVIVLRCDTDAEAVHLTNIFADIQNKVKSENVELKKRDNGNWTLRGRTDHNANRHLQEIFNEHKQPNGDVVAVKTDEDITYVPVLDAREVYKNNNHHRDEDVSIKNSRSDIRHMIIAENDQNEDDYVIETEVVTHPHVSAEIHADHEGNDIREATSRFEHVSMVDKVDGGRVHAHGKHLKHTEATVLPSKPVVYRATSSGVVSSQPMVYSTSSSIAVPSEPIVYSSSSSRRMPSETIAYNTSASRSMPSETVVYNASTSRSMPSEPIVYSASRAAHSQPVIYRATSSRAAPSQPLVHSASARSSDPTFTATSAGFYTNPWAQRRVSRDSSIIPMRANGSQTFVKFDQQSILSNTSRLSRSSKFGYSEISIPTTIQRSIENVYPQPVVILRRARGYPSGYRPRPASYHARTDLKVYYEEDPDRGMLL